MTARVFGGASALPFEVATFDHRLLEAMVLRRCAQYRKAFRGSAVSYPADLLRLEPVARWVTGQGLTVDVRSVEQLREAGAAGVRPRQLVVHCADMPKPILRSAVDIGAGRFVVDSIAQVEALASARGQTRQVVVDTSARDVEDVVAGSAESRGLNLIGLHCRLIDDVETDAVAATWQSIARMSRIRRRHPLLLTRISLADVDAGEGGRYHLRHFAEAIEDAVEDACIWMRYPRPALTLAPSPSALSPKP